MEKIAFVDYYELMQISPNAEPDTIEGVYRLLAASFDAEIPGTAGNERLVQLMEAHRILSDRASRAAYDLIYRAKRDDAPELSNLNEIVSDIDRESKRRMGILRLLYARRRSNGDHPGMSLLEFESQMSFPREQLMFTIWYLQTKGLIQRGEESDFAITVDGVDYVEQHVSRDIGPRGL